LRNTSVKRRFVGAPVLSMAGRVRSAFAARSGIDSLLLHKADLKLDVLTDNRHKDSSNSNGSSLSDCGSSRSNASNNRSNNSSSASIRK